MTTKDMSQSRFRLDWWIFSWCALLFLGMLLGVRMGKTGNPAVMDLVNAAILSAVMLVAVTSIRRRHLRRHTGDAFDQAAEVLAVDDLLEQIGRLVVTVDVLPNDHTAACRVIDSEIRPWYDQVARQLADRVGLVGEHQVEIQTALGDLMVQVERIWTMLAEQAFEPGRAAWTAARAHAARVHGLVVLARVEQQKQRLTAEDGTAVVRPAAAANV